MEGFYSIIYQQQFKFGNAKCMWAYRLFRFQHSKQLVEGFHAFPSGGALSRGISSRAGLDILPGMDLLQSQGVGWRSLVHRDYTRACGEKITSDEGLQFRIK